MKIISEFKCDTLRVYALQKLTHDGDVVTVLIYYRDKALRAFSEQTKAEILFAYVLSKGEWVVYEKITQKYLDKLLKEEVYPTENENCTIEYF